MIRKLLPKITAIVALAALAAVLAWSFLSSHPFFWVFGRCFGGTLVGTVFFAAYNAIESAVILCMYLSLLALFHPVFKKIKHPDIVPICLASLFSSCIASRLVRCNA